MLSIAWPLCYPFPHLDISYAIRCFLCYPFRPPDGVRAWKVGQEQEIVKIWQDVLNQIVSVCSLSSRYTLIMVLTLHPCPFQDPNGFYLRCTKDCMYFYLIYFLANLLKRSVKVYIGRLIIQYKVILYIFWDFGEVQHIFFS